MKSIIVSEKAEAKEKLFPKLMKDQEDGEIAMVLDAKGNCITMFAGDGDCGVSSIGDCYKINDITSRVDFNETILLSND